MSEWNGKPIAEMGDSHLTNALAKAEEIVANIEEQIEDCEDWQYDKVDRLEEKLDEWRIKVEDLEDEFKARGLDQPATSEMLS